MSTPQLEHRGDLVAHGGAVKPPVERPRKPEQLTPRSPLQQVETPRLPTPLERSCALVLADHDRRNLLGRWLTLMGATSCRTTLDSTPLSALTPDSSNELVVAETPADEVDTKVISLRTRGWRNIIVSTGDIDADTAAAALRRDVRALMRRNSQTPGNPSTQRNATNQAANGAVISPESTARNLPQPNGAQALTSQLTDRECAVLKLVARGKSNREIGTELTLSPLTIKSHLSRISRKLGTGDRARMVLIALRGGAIA